MHNNDVFKDLYSLKQASDIWNIEESVLRRHILNNKFVIDVDAKKFGKQWIISKHAMEREYGIIENKNSDDMKYSKNKLMDIYYYISDCIIKYSNKYNIEIDMVAKLFNKNNIFKYIYDCYDYLHLGNTNDVVKDIASRIRRGINYD